MDSVPLSHRGLKPGSSAGAVTPYNRASVFIPALVILIGMALRFGMLGVDLRLHPDEALFATQARIISHQGDWLLHYTDLDKPPLTFFTTALSFYIFEPSEFAARLPNTLLSGLSLALLYHLAWALYQDRVTAGLATLLLALSPYDLAFAATVFTDIQATMWILAASIFAVHDRWRWVGVAAALTFAAKSNTLLFGPLILALGLVHNARSGWRSRDVWRRVWRYLWPLVVGIIIVVLWDLGRAPRSFLSLGYERNNPGRVIYMAEAGPRLARWLHWLGFLTGSRLLNLFLLVTGLLWLIKKTLRCRFYTTCSRTTLFDGIIAGFALVFLLGHWLIAFNTYDRYLHTLTPFLLLLAARLLTGLWHGLGSHVIGLGIVIALVVGLMFPAINTTLHGAAAIGGDQGKHTGIDTLAEHLNTHLRGAMIYDHWLGWELAYYLGEAPQVQIIYHARPEDLAQDLLRHAEPRYLVAPSIPRAQPWIATLHQLGIATMVSYHDPTHEFVIFRLERQQR